MRQSTGKNIEHGIVISCVIILVAIMGGALYSLMVNRHEQRELDKWVAAEQATRAEQKKAADFFTKKDSTKNFKFDLIITERKGGN